MGGLFASRAKLRRSAQIYGNGEAFIPALQLWIFFTIFRKTKLNSYRGGCEGREKSAAAGGSASA